MIKPFKFVPVNSTIAFMTVARPALYVSAAAVVVAVVLFLSMGLNLGIDFRGGTLIEIETDGPAEIGQLRDTLGSLGLGDVQIQEFGAEDEVLIRIEVQPGGDEAQIAARTRVREALGESVIYKRVEVVGPTVSGELAQQGTIAVLAAIFAVLVYIWFRFEWQFSVGAVAALVHDVMITIGVFSLLQLEFNLSIIAALLTIVGYSLNDTVVVFDRVRENLRKYKKLSLNDLLNQSINQTLSRTILTSVTTLIALLSLYTFGGEVIRGFTFAMIWGVVIGTYSSICIASPLLNILGVKRDWSGHGENKAKGAEAGAA
jgi:preprotein translocase SecF subunit